MLALDYFEWSEVSGLYIRNFSHAERFQTYQQLISQPGLNVVIVADFLRSNPEELNVVQWRASSVYEMGDELAQRLSFTVDALNAIGAKRLARFLTFIILIITASGCPDPANRPVGGVPHPRIEAAESLDELADRFKNAFRAKDADAIGKLTSYILPDGTAELSAKDVSLWQSLFALDLIDAEFVKFDPPPGAEVELQYLVERLENGGNSRSFLLSSIHYNQPSKLLLYAHHPDNPNGPAMEIDLGIGVDLDQGWYSIKFSDNALRQVATWIDTGKLPDIYHSPNHQEPYAVCQNVVDRGQVPKDWHCIVRPRP